MLHRMVGTLLIHQIKSESTSTFIVLGEFSSLPFVVVVVVVDLHVISSRCLFKMKAELLDYHNDEGPGL